MSILKVANIHFETAGTNRIDYLGDSKIRITSANGTVLSGSTADALLRITQTGAGEAIRVEDETNPDSTPFIVDATGNVLIGRTNSTVGLGVKLDVSGSVNATSVISPNIIFDSISASFIRANGANTIAFHTAGVEDLRIDAAGNVLIGRTNSTVGSGVKLDINGALNCSNILVNGAAFLGGATLTDQTTATELQYITFTTRTSSTATSLNVASTKLTFNAATGTLSSTLFNSTSDVNKKQDIVGIDNALEIISQINGVRFNWKDNGLPSLGVIAQDVEKILPELVDDSKSVNYNGLIAVLIEAIKDLQYEIDQLKLNMKE